MNNLVSLAKVTENNIKDSVSTALNSLDFKLDHKLKSVFIKVNLCYYWDAFTGYTTDPRLVAATIDVLREKYGLENADIKIVEADATAMRTSHAFRMLGYEKLAEEKEVELFNLSLDKIIEMKVTVNGREISFPIPESLLKADLFINMPKMKIMSATTITCAFKNLFGCIASPRKIIYHPILSEAIVGVNKILHPHLTIVDGIVALGQHPVNLNLIVAGFNSFAVDWVVSEIMGYNPSRISYLKLAQAAGVGTPNDIKVVGEKIEQFRNQFPHVNAFLLKRQNNLQLKLLRLYSRTVGDVIPPILEK